MDDQKTWSRQWGFFPAGVASTLQLFWLSCAHRHPLSVPTPLTPELWLSVLVMTSGSLLLRGEQRPRLVLSFSAIGWNRLLVFCWCILSRRLCGRAAAPDRALPVSSDHCPEMCVCVCMCENVCVLRAADLCVLFQKESPSTSRQSPANGHSSINSSILVRTPLPTPPTNPRLSPHRCVSLSLRHAVVVQHVRVSFKCPLTVIISCLSGLVTVWAAGSLDLCFRYLS